MADYEVADGEMFGCLAFALMTTVPIVVGLIALAYVCG